MELPAPKMYLEKWEDCQAACDSSDACEAYSFKSDTTPKGGCWLFRTLKYGTKIADDKAITGRKWCKIPSTQLASDLYNSIVILKSGQSWATSSEVSLRQYETLNWNRNARTAGNQKEWQLPGVWRNAQWYKLGGTKLVGTQSKPNRKSRSTSASSYRAASMVTLTRGGQKMCALKQALRKATQKNITICRGKMWTAYDGVPEGKRENLGRSNTSAMGISLLDVFPHSCLIYTFRYNSLVDCIWVLDSVKVQWNRWGTSSSSSSS